MKKIYWDVILLIGTIATLFSSYLIYYEIHEAKLFCESIDGEYVIKVYPLPIQHTCDDKKIIQYPEGWEFEGERADFSNITIQIPK